MAAKNIGREEFKELLASGKPFVVDFWAPWCGYCRRISAPYDKIAGQYADSLVVAKINIDDAPLLAEQERIEVIPSLVLYRGGKAIGSIVAPESKSAIDVFLREHL